MNPSSKRLDPVKNVTSRREKHAANRLGKAKASVIQAIAKLDELESYRLQYLSEFQQRATRGMSSSQMQYYQRFLIQLDKAISTQQQQIEHLQQAVTSEHHNWQQKNQRNQAVKKYQTTLKEKESSAADRKQARLVEDEFNNRKR